MRTLSRWSTPVVNLSVELTSMLLRGQDCDEQGALCSQEVAETVNFDS